MTSLAERILAELDAASLDDGATSSIGLYPATASAAPHDWLALTGGRDIGRTQVHLRHDLLEHGAAGVDVRVVGAAHADVHAADGVVRDVVDGRAEDGAVGHDHAPVVQGLELTGEQLDLLHHAVDARHLHVVADLEGTEDQQHDAGGEVAERALEGQADREAASRDEPGEAGRLDAKDAHAAERDARQDGVAHEVGEEARQRQVELARLEGLA